MHSTTHAHRIGVIDIGSNSIRLVIYDGMGRAPLPLFNEKAFCGLGRGLSLTGKLNPEGKKLARTSMARLLTIARLMDVVELKIIATAAIRDASDGKAFAQELEKKHDIRISVIAGTHEARLAASGIMSAFYKPSGLVGDMGGGSMELIALKDHTITAQETLPIGPLRLLDSCKNNPEKIRKAVKKAFATLPWLSRGRPACFYAVGGSFRTIARIHMQQVKYPLPVLHHYTVLSSDILKLLKSIQTMDAVSLSKLPGVSNKRASAMIPAAIVLQTLIETTKVPLIVFSASGIREGYLYEKLLPSVRNEDPLIASATAMADAPERAHYAHELFDWMSPLFKKESESEKRIRLAACTLSDIAWRIHPEFRAEWAFHHVLQSSLIGITHAERITLALTLYHCYQHKLKHESIVLTLITDRQRIWAKRVGMACSLAYQLSGGMAGNLAHAKLHLVSRSLKLHLAQRVKSLLSDAVKKRVDGLGDAFKATSNRRK